MKKITIFTISIMLFGSSIFAQKNDKKNSISQAIESKQYVFKARNAMPSTGSTRQLSSTYDFTVSHDSAIANLPYFGRAYSATPGKLNGGIEFTSTDFTYKVSEGKKGGWTIEINPKDADDVQQLSLNVSKDGFGTLHVNSRNRQPISFGGRIEPIGEK